MCAKEFSALAATIITQLNAQDEALVDEAGEPLPAEKQGFAFIEDTTCDEASELGDEECQLMGAGAANVPDFYADKTQPDHSSVSFTPRGAGYLYGADKYYWFSKIVAGDTSVFEDPTLMSTNVEYWWLSGLVTWMVPMEGRPAPHNIMMGQWEPSEAELDANIVNGFGAVSQLFYGESQCGMAGHPIANLRTEIYESLIAEFAGDDWTAAETVASFESNDCVYSYRTAFPDYGEYADVPLFATREITNTSDETETSDSCFVVDQRTEYIIWEKNAFRQCVFDAYSAGR